MSIPGHDICDTLKEIRREIARRNKIDLQIEECTYKGECFGTCPKCEREVEFLELALSKIKNPIINKIAVKVVENHKPSEKRLSIEEFLQKSKLNNPNQKAINDMTIALNKLRKEYEVQKDKKDINPTKIKELKTGIKNLLETIDELKNSY